MTPLPVYVIHWNAPDWCVATVASLATSTIPVAVTVVDNGGARLSLDPGTRVLRQSENRGYTGGANAALADWLAGDAELAVIASHDLSVEAETLQTLCAAMGSRSQLGICGPAFGSAGSAGGELIVADGEFEAREWISGTCLMIRRACAEAVGTFDEEFGSYVEDVDYCNRARRAGWMVGKVLGARASGQGSGSGSLNALRMIHSNAILLGFKEGGIRGATGPAWRTARLSLASLRHGRFAQSFACWRGVGSGIQKCVRYRRQRGTPGTK